MASLYWTLTLMNNNKLLLYSSYFVGNNKEQVVAEEFFVIKLHMVNGQCGKEMREFCILGIWECKMQTSS